MILENRVETLVKKFTGASSWEERYKNLIDMGRKLPPLPEKFKVDANKVKGCVSQVWLVPHWQGGKITFLADSDAGIVKGILALILAIYSDATPEEILATRPHFVDRMRLKQHLSINRANGMGSILKQISIYALAFQAKYGKGETVATENPSPTKSQE